MLTQITLVMRSTDACSGRYTEAATFKGIEGFSVEKETAFSVLTECRVVRVSALCMS